MDYADIQALITQGAQESPHLEFKQTLSRTGTGPSELVKDITGMANADGGRIYYGVDEKAQADSIPVASGIVPIVDAGVTPEWIAQIVHGNSGPPFRGFATKVVAAPNGGRILVVDIEAASTAHQNEFDHKYYQRVDRIVKPMLDYQIRDVMGRRTAPVIDVRLDRVRLQQPHGEQRRAWVPVLENVGVLSLERWSLRVDLPFYAHKADLDRDQQLVNWRIDDVDVDGTRVRRCTVDSRALPHFCTTIEPGQLVRLDINANVGQLRTYVANDNHAQLKNDDAAIRWCLFMRNAKPIEGALAFDEWCQF